MKRKEREISKEEAFPILKIGKGKRKVHLSNKRVKYYVIFVNKSADAFEFLGRKRVHPNVNIIRYKIDNSHLIDISKPTYRNGLKKYYFIDINEGQLFYVPTDVKYDKALLDKMFKQGFFRVLTSSLMDKSMADSWIMRIVFLAFGVMIGFFIKGFF